MLQVAGDRGSGRECSQLEGAGRLLAQVSHVTNNNLYSFRSIRLSVLSSWCIASSPLAHLTVYMAGFE